MDPLCLGKCSLYMHTIFEKCPFKENSKLSKLFHLVPRGLNLLTEPNLARYQSIRPRRAGSCGVSDPMELSLVGYQTLRNIGKVVYIL
jgi:hypothetical protein